MASLLWVSAETPDRYGQGGQRRQYHQIRALTQLGHSVRVLALASAQSASSVKEVCEVRRARVAIKRIYLPALERRLHKQINNDQSDVLIVSHIESCSMLPDDLRADRPSLLDVHNVTSDWFMRRGLREQAEVALVKERHALERFTVASTCSELETERLIYRHPAVKGRVFAAPLGVDPDEWPDIPRSRQDAIVALFGSWDWLPNELGLHWFVQEVWPLVVEACPQARALVAGSGVATQANWPASVTYVGRVSSLAEFTAQATVVAVPVLMGVGASVKFAEALASGASVVATSDGASAFPTSPAFISDDAESWAQWIIDRLIRRGQEEVPAPTREYALRDLNWASAVRPINAWLQSVLGNS